MTLSDAHDKVDIGSVGIEAKERERGEGERARRSRKKKRASDIRRRAFLQNLEQAFPTRQTLSCGVPSHSFDSEMAADNVDNRKESTKSESKCQRRASVRFVLLLLRHGVFLFLALQRLPRSKQKLAATNGTLQSSFELFLFLFPTRRLGKDISLPDRG